MARKPRPLILKSLSQTPATPKQSAMISALLDDLIAAFVKEAVGRQADPSETGEDEARQGRPINADPN